jgi:endonuclease/exonuclease/phosphatase family metal-dependent hydrolase
MMRKLSLTLLLAVVLVFPVSGQASGETLKVVFWNVENLFDTVDDSLTNDDEYLPYGIRGWSKERYQEKLFKIYKTLVAIGEWEFPPLLALAEVENKQVLQDLLDYTPLMKAGYQIVHQDSEDRRGIDLALLYRPDQLQILDTTFIQLSFPDAPQSKSRDIIHVVVKPDFSEPFHLFVNHWPSRYGGGRSSESRRIFAASVVRKNLDSLYLLEPQLRAVVMGDFNDVPEDASLKELNRAQLKLNHVTAQSFYGTHKFQGVWSHFDQVWVSESLMHIQEGFSLSVAAAHIFHPEWLLETDKSYGGLKPNRSYEGYRYHGGFSDHLPLFLELTMPQPPLADGEQ